MIKINKENLNKLFIEGNLLSPLPVILVGTKVHNKPNYLVITIKDFLILEVL